MKFPYLFVVCALLCLTSVAVAQGTPPKIYVIGQVIDTTSWLMQSDKDILDSMHQTYKAPSIFEQKVGWESFKDQPRLWDIVRSVNHKLQSKDGEFVAFIGIYKPFGRSDSIRMTKLFKKEIDLIDKQHIAHIQANITGSLGKAAAANWKDYVLYLPSEEAHKKFNADTVIQVPIKLDSSTFYKGKYNHLEALYLQKKSRGFLTFYIFYTDKAKDDLVKYKKAIEGIFRYED